ncbi:Cystathionine gamma-synthase [Cyphellophora attinorum]|uniref:cystathionine gamma-synthase n=1 Tax=Cyphellophora attinorum TaxID=1664694 RepID=A0A0N1H2B5_9EURO|nr:Cystathionine gamma-synthase [Phialophora attinorum]KPI34392.1 Cystathionine gamma-synthase [Phialophora attinorum]
MLAAVGAPVPNTAHAVSVSLPSWKANVGYEEGEDWVVSKMQTGYPRFFIHLTIQELEREIMKKYGKNNERVMLFPSPATAKRCQKFFHDRAPNVPITAVRLLNLEPKMSSNDHDTVLSGVYCIFFPKEHFPIAKQVWQHTGDGISSRRGEFCLKALQDGYLQPVVAPGRIRSDSLYTKGPRRYQRGGSQNNINFLVNLPDPSPAGPIPEDKDYATFVEERFGRNLNIQLAEQAKVAMRRRIAGCLTDNLEPDEALFKSSQCTGGRHPGMTEDHVFLYPTGMSAIFNTHRMLRAHAEKEGRPPLKSICFGFTYIDTLKILEKWGPGCLFYGRGDSADLDDLERRLKSGERYLSLFTEFPSNPLLHSSDLPRLRRLADEYDFAIAVDETVGNVININVLPYADIVMSSLTKVFSGDSNVMGGSAILNPHSKHFDAFRQTVDKEYEDNYWAEDAVFMERNSRDFISRIDRINTNADAIATTLRNAKNVKAVYYPKYVASRPNYDTCRHPNGGYGGLLSVVFNRPEQAVAFFDALEVQKGPSLGTNFTLACPYTVLAHYTEMEWTAEWGVDPDLVRVSVGLEDTGPLVECFERALAAAAAA